MCKSVFLFFMANMVSISASAAIAPPWVHLANKNCKEGDSTCIDGFRNKEIEHSNQFRKENPLMQNVDFLVQECVNQNLNTQEGCMQMYKVNHLKVPNNIKNSN